MGIGSPPFTSSAVTSWNVQTLVSVGPYQFATRQDGGRLCHRSPSGPTGISSPAKMIWRRALRWRSASDSVALARSRADGTEYQTVTPLATMKRHRLAVRPNVEAGTSASRAAAAAAPKKSNTLRSNDGDACCETTSFSSTPTASTAHRTNASALAFVCATPFGRPVDPDVYRMYASAEAGGSTGERNRPNCRSRDKLSLTGWRSGDLSGSNQPRPSQCSAGELSPRPS